MDTKQDALNYIHSLGRFSGKPGLHRIRALCSALGDPQKELRFVHIAGTNGKGSIACMTASVLRAAGYKTGLYTSPYLVHFNERIRVDGVKIPYPGLIRLTNQVAEACEGLTLPDGESIGEFEFTTAMAFLYFLEQGCDIVVLETGLGGRFDATNIIGPPEACVITPISLDHTEVLGDSVAEIALEKLGIIKAGAVAVCAPDQPSQVRAVVRSACMHTGAELFGSPAQYAEYGRSGRYRLLRCDVDGSAFELDGQGYSLSMPGFHQIKNALTALSVVDALRGRGWEIPVSAAVKGLARARLPGRLERVRETPLVLLDGAHNAEGAEALCRFIDTQFKMRRVHIVMGMMRDKAYEQCIRDVASRADVFCACSPEHNERALPAQTIAAIAERHCKEVYDCGDAEKALRLAIENAGPEDVVIVCGSLYLVGEAQKLLGARQKPPE